MELKRFYETQKEKKQLNNPAGVDTKYCLWIYYYEQRSYYGAKAENDRQTEVNNLTACPKFVFDWSFQRTRTRKHGGRLKLDVRHQWTKPCVFILYRFIVRI